MKWRSLTVAVAALVLVTAGCGSSSETATTTAPQQSASAQFASDVCGSLLMWKTNVTKAAKTVKADPSEEQVKAAITHVENWTSALAQKLKSLQVPETQSAATAKSTMTTLSDQLHQDVATIQKSIEGVSGLHGSVEALTAVGNTLVTARNQVKQAGDQLRALPKGELKQAFLDSPACQTLTAAGGAGGA